ncbi:MAG TPA: ATP-binding protein [Chryseosolibacter sp.]
MKPSVSISTDIQIPKVEIHFGKSIYTLTGSWTTRAEENSVGKLDLNKLNLSFDTLITINRVNHLIHPDDARQFKTLVQANAGNSAFNCELRVIGPDREARWLQGSDVKRIEGEPGIMSSADPEGCRTALAECQRVRQVQGFLLKLTDAFLSADDVDTVQFGAVSLLGKYMHAGRSFYCEIDADNDHMLIRRDYTDGGVKSQAGIFRISDFGPFLVNEYRAGRTVVIDDTSTDERLTAAERNQYPSEHVGAFVCVPLIKAGRLAGVLAINQPGSRSWTSGEVEMIEETAERTWAAVERAKADDSLRKNEQRLRDVNTKLQQTDKAKTKFFHNVSHEFRTPLTLLLGPLDDVIKSVKSKLVLDDQQKLQFLHRSAVRLQKLVNTLLDFARIEGGKIEAFYQPTDFGSTTVELAANFRSAIEKAGLKYVVKADETLEHVYLNREMWEKIVFNLLSNAFKFTHHGKIEVNIRDKKKTVELRVKDSGIGIADKNLERIFDRFTRIEGIHARTYEGTGIGLALVRELVAAHSGVIKVKSAVGVGSEFIISIPKGKAHLSKQQIYESKERLGGEDIKAAFIEELLGWRPEDDKVLKRKLKNFQKDGASRILIAEDNADMRDYLTHMLSDDYHILALEHGKKVVDYFNDGGEADLILADVMMPEIDGFKLVELMKSNPKLSEIPLILLSARTTEEAKISGLDMGADDYVIKPLYSNELRALIRSRIRMYHTRKLSKEELSHRAHELEDVVQARTLELRELNESLKQRNMRLTALNDEMTNFAFIASHDLREPLRKIQLYASEVAEKESAISDRGKTFATKIIASVLRMNDLIEDVLKYTKISSQPRNNFSEHDLNSLLTDSLAELGDLIERSGARIIANKLPTLTCNSLQICQLMQNLISNAIKFQPQNQTAEVTITAHIVPGESISSPLADMNVNYVKLEVADNGIGIEEKYLNRIFGIFQRLHGKSSYPGTGIGLAICKKVVENHRGFILAKSTPGEGSVFTCFFPISQ